MIHARIQEFSSGGVSRSIWNIKKSSDNVFFYFIFLVLNLFYRSPVGVDFFTGGVQLFTGGSICFFPIETHITCDFPWGKTPSGSAHVIPRIVV